MMAVTTVLSSISTGLIAAGFCCIGPWRRKYFVPSGSGWTLWKPLTRGQIYCDDDGEAIDAKGHDPERWSVIATFPLAFIALALSVLSLVLAGVSVSRVLILVAWAVLTLDALVLGRQTSQQQRFEVGLLLSPSAFVQCIAIVISILLGSQPAEQYTTTVLYVSNGVSAAIALALAFISANLRRRPSVHFEGKEVDGQFTTTAIGRYAYSWIRPLLDEARKSRRLEYADLPALDHATRSQDLKRRIESQQPEKSLWRALVHDHVQLFARQWGWSIIESFVAILPSFCLFQILSWLEKRASGDSVPPNVIWLWVLCLAGSKIRHVAMENWLWWLSFALIATPVRSQLSAAIIAKALRMKAVESDSSASNDEDEKSSKKVDVSGKDDDNEDALVEGEVEAQETDTLLPNAEAVEHHKAAEAPKDDKDSDDTATRGIVNLLGVDVQRVSEFCGFNNDLLRGVVKIVLAAVFLVSLLGWWSTLAGFAVPVLLQPLNNVATKHYTSKQLLVMGARDNKAHVVTEALQGIRQIKFSATEAQWEKRILKARERELKAQWGIYVWAIFLTFIWWTMPALIGAAALGVYALTTGRMVASVAFTALSVFSSLEWTIGVIPVTITEMIDARVSAKRIEDHLASEERSEEMREGNAVELSDTTVTWPSTTKSQETFRLHGLDLRFPKNELSVIHGQTGTGKSLLLNAIIGEAEVISGEILIPQASTEEVWSTTTNLTHQNWIVPSAMAYVSQVPWIENASFKDAITFGLPYRQERYTQVLHACALQDDIKILPDGEDTEIGATGINLSGGQRWRLTLARALYSRAGILVFDDIFSAVDSHVGRHLLQHGILGPLGEGRTKILVTHHTDLVAEHAAYIVRLGGGTAADVIRKHPETRVNVTGGVSAAVAKEDDDDDSSPDPAEANALDADPAGSTSKKQAQKFVQDETREYGRVKWSVYKAYIMASGGRFYWVFIIGLYSLAAASTVMRSYWLALWTDAYTTEDSSKDSARTVAAAVIGPEQAGADHHLLFYLGIYLGISLFSITLQGVKIIFVLTASLRAARKLFEVVTRNVLRAPLRWLDTEPVGRILNRFVGDFSLIDSRLGGDVNWTMNSFFSLVTIVAAALFVSFWMAIPIVILSGLGVYVVYLYLDAARDIKRLESSAKSPIFELVGSILSGLPTIRCFGKSPDYLSRMYAAVDTYAQTTWYVLLATQWMNFRQGILGVLFTLCIAVAVAGITSIEASLAGFALSFALDFSTVAQRMISKYTAAELDMNSTERVLEYMNLSTEPLTGRDAPAAWPSKGRIDVKGLEVGYARDLPSVLKGLTFSVEPGTRLGIVGRTGSGKSSMTLALFRFLEARKGSINIDGVDISTLKLNDLRSRLAIIPQDPVLFSGTLRANLDPFDEYDDSTLLNALDRLGLTKRASRLSQSDTTTATGATKANGKKSSQDGDHEPPSHNNGHQPNIFTNLSSQITRGGSNLSQGEKQLVCLARAMISQPRILVLDEATSAVDMETDALIQRSIRDEFVNTTLLVVAHRLSTVVDFDKILVMSDGRVAEYDSPGTLVKREDGALRKMVMDSGEREKLMGLLG